MAQHPPLYYLVMGAAGAGATFVLPGSLRFDQELLLLRVLSLTMLLPLPYLTYQVVGQLTSDRAARLSGSVMLLALPGLTARNGPMVNNDNLLVLLGGISLLYLLRVARGDRRWSTALILGSLVAAAMWTKAFGAVILPLLVGAYAYPLLRRRNPREIVAAGARVGAAGLLGGLVGSAWWIRNWFAYGRVRPLGIEPPVAPPDFSPDWAHWVTHVLWHSWNSFWGGTWVLSADDYAVLLAVLVAATCVIVGASFLLYPYRGLLVLALSPVLMMMLAVYGNSFVTYPEYGIIAAIHGRYFYLGLPGILACMAVGSVLIAGRHRRRWVPSGLFAATIILQAVTVRAVLNRNWGEAGDPLGERWAAMLAWAPIAPGWSYAITGATLATLVWVGVWVAITGLRPGAAHDSGGTEGSGHHSEPLPRPIND